MNADTIIFRKFALALQEQCSFIMFAMIAENDGRCCGPGPETIELAVFIGPGTGTLSALEKIIDVTAGMTGRVNCEVTLLNLADPVTRYRAAAGTCLFVRQGREQQCRQFAERARLDYRIMRAQGRRRGVIGIE